MIHSRELYHGYLAPDRVYHSSSSRRQERALTLPRFTLTTPTECRRAVLFLWHFPSALPSRTSADCLYRVAVSNDRDRTAVLEESTAEVFVLSSPARGEGDHLVNLWRFYSKTITKKCQAKRVAIA